MTNCWQITQLSRTFRSDHQCNFNLFVLFMVKHMSIFSVKWMTCFQGKLLHKFHLCQRLCHFGLFLDGFFERLARVLHSVCVLGHRLSNWRMPLCGLYRIVFGCKKLTELRGAQAVKYWGGQIGKKSLICLEGKSMTPHRGNTILFCSPQQLPRLRLGPLKGCLNWHGALTGPSTRLVRCFRNYRGSRIERPQHYVPC